MLAMGQAILRRPRVADWIAVASLAAYALVIVAMIALPLAQRPSPRGSEGAAAAFAAQPRRSPPVSAEELALAPRYENVRPERSAHISRTWRKIGGVGVNVVTVNPKARNVRIVLGLAKGTVLSEGKFGREAFGDMVRRFKPRVAINGTYFDLRTNEPVGALVMEGRLIYDGICSSTLLISEDGETRIEYHLGKMGRNLGWERDVRTALCSGPMLVHNGEVSLKPYDEGFGDPSLFAVARRSAIGVTADGKLLAVTVHTPITLNKLAHIMLRLDAAEAMNLDGGTSSALYSNGKFVTLPGRPLTNLLLVYD
jgi:hypothetical protein